MNRDLTAKEIVSMLKQQKYGHLGCTLQDGRVYVVPVTYVFHDDSVYCFSYPGLKIDALRSHPAVCFQLQRPAGEGAWESVILWGTFEELTHEKRINAIKIIFDRLEEEEDITLSPLFRKPDHAKRSDVVFYRINITEKTGKRVQNDY